MSFAGSRIAIDGTSGSSSIDDAAISSATTYSSTKIISLLAGSATLVWRGTYNPVTVYIINDVCEYSGSSYICIQAGAGNTPPAALFWNLMAQAGSPGATGTSFTWQGPFDIGQGYFVNDVVVASDNSSYICILACTGVDPRIANPNWARMAKAGADGSNGSIGPQGPQGPQGPAGADGLSFVWMGPWAVGQAYLEQYVVEYLGASYICITPNTGVYPTTSLGVDWELFTAKGIDGATTGQMLYLSDVKPYPAPHTAYEVLRPTPFNGAEVVESPTFTLAAPATVGRFMTAVGYPGVGTIRAGTWVFTSWASVNAGATSTLEYNLYALAETTNVETLLFTTTSPVLPTTSEWITTIATVASPITLPSTSRLVLYIVAKTTTSTSRTLTFVYQGVAHAGYIQSTLAQTSVPSLQTVYDGDGGTINLSKDKPLAITEGTAFTSTVPLFKVASTIGDQLAVYNSKVVAGSAAASVTTLHLDSSATGASGIYFDSAGGIGSYIYVDQSANPKTIAFGNAAGTALSLDTGLAQFAGKVTSQGLISVMPTSAANQGTATLQYHDFGSSRAHWEHIVTKQTVNLNTWPDMRTYTTSDTGKRAQVEKRFYNPGGTNPGYDRHIIEYSPNTRLHLGLVDTDAIAYAAGTTYVRNEQCTYGNATTYYRCLVETSTGVLPSNTTNWINVGDTANSYALGFTLSHDTGRAACFACGWNEQFEFQNCFQSPWVTIAANTFTIHADPAQRYTTTVTPIGIGIKFPTITSTVRSDAGYLHTIERIEDVMDWGIFRRQHPMNQITWNLVDHDATAWSSTRTYAMEEQCMGGASYYRSIQANNTNHATSDTNWWLLLTYTDDNYGPRILSRSGGPLTLQMGLGQYIHFVDAVGVSMGGVNSGGLFMNATNYAGSGGIAGYVDANRNLIAHSSSIRYKEDLTVLSSALLEHMSSCIDQLVVTDFRWKDIETVHPMSRGTRSVGLIAEEAMAVCPDIVSLGVNGEAVGMNDYNIIVHLIAKTQCLTKRVTLLEAMPQAASQVTASVVAVDASMSDQVSALETMLQQQKDTNDHQETLIASALAYCAELNAQLKVTKESLASAESNVADIMARLAVLEGK